jgi:dienelactone hydrolase
VVVIHEAFGLNENIRDVARRFAAHGYAAFAVDLFAGRNRAVCTARFMGGMLRGTSPVPSVSGTSSGRCPSSASSPAWTPKGSGL